MYFPRKPLASGIKGWWRTRRLHLLRSPLVQGWSRAQWTGELCLLQASRGGCRCPWGTCGCFFLSLSIPACRGEVASQAASSVLPSPPLSGLADELPLPRATLRAAAVLVRDCLYQQHGLKTWCSPLAQEERLVVSSLHQRVPCSAQGSLLCPRAGPSAGFASGAVGAWPERP